VRLLRGKNKGPIITKATVTPVPGAIVISHSKVYASGEALEIFPVSSKALEIFPVSEGDPSTNTKLFTAVDANEITTFIKVMDRLLENVVLNERARCLDIVREPITVSVMVQKILNGE